MNLKKRLAVIITSAMLAVSALSIGAAAANTEFNVRVTGTGSKTIVTQTTNMKKLSLYVTVCDFASIFTSDIDYELSAPYYSDVQSGKTGNYYYNPFNGTSKTYYLTAECQGVTVKADISGNYDITTM